MTEEHAQQEMLALLMRHRGYGLMLSQISDHSTMPLTVAIPALNRLTAAGLLCRRGPLGGDPDDYVYGITVVGIIAYQERDAAQTAQETPHA